MRSHLSVRRVVVATVLTALATVAGLLTAVSPTTAASPNPITPGVFTGKGFDQCEAPTQKSMDAWLASSPYRAVGIYISGSLRFCQAQTNLTPTWVATQLAKGWHLLPIHLGVQASCSTRDRYQNTKTTVNKIKTTATNNYSAAQQQGRSEADIAVAAATRLGIVPRSTIFYDLEGFPMNKAACQQSALWFLHAWTDRLHQLGYVSGVYSSAASGMKILDDARVKPDNPITLPDQLWIADWNGKANDQSSYIRSDGWVGRRLHQYKGGHNETWGKVTINVDNNYLRLTDIPLPAGNASITTQPISSPAPTDRCTSTALNKRAYRLTGAKRGARQVTALQCLLRERGLYSATVTGKWNKPTATAVKAFQRQVRHRVQARMTRADWTALLAAGNSGTVLKPGLLHADVIRVQRALNAARAPRLPITGVYDAKTVKAVTTYQRKAMRITPTGVVAELTWAALSRGQR